MAKLQLIIAALVLSLLSSANSLAQGYFKYSVLGRSNLKDDLGNRYGRGGMEQYAAGYTVPFFAKMNEREQLKTFSASLYADYATFSNSDAAQAMNPDDILNGGFNLTFLTPVSRRWSLMVVAGAGVYAPTDEMAWRSILANGGFIFIHKLGKQVDWGIGAGVSNSYGTPIAMPMLYFAWHCPGMFSFKVEMANSMKVGVSARLCKWFTAELAAIEMSGMAAVIKTDGKQKIYSMADLHSAFTPTFSLGKHISLYGSVGATWVRSISVSERSLSAFFKNFKEESHDPYYCPALTFSAGISYGF